MCVGIGLTCIHHLEYIFELSEDFVVLVGWNIVCISFQVYSVEVEEGCVLN